MLSVDDKNDSISNHNTFHDGQDNGTDIDIMESLNSAQFEMLIPAFVLVLATMAVGIGGNSITLLVYWKKMRRTASRVFIISLALCDLINCTLTMPVEIAIICRYWTFDYPVICSIGRTITYILNGTSALLLVGIAFDRFRKICRPLKPVFTPKNTRIICLISAAVGFAVYIPGFVIYGTETFVINITTNLTVFGKTCLISDPYVHTKFPLYCMAFWFTLTVIVMVALIGLYSSIGRAVYVRMKLEEKRHNSASSMVRPKRTALVEMEEETSCSFNDILDEYNPRAGTTKTPAVLTKMEAPTRSRLSEVLKNRFNVARPSTVYSLPRKRESKRIRAGRTTVMLFAITVAYILSFIPFLVIVVIRTLKPELYIALTVTRKTVWNFFLRSYVLNCSMNPLIYGFCNKDYRKKMCELFREFLRCSK